MPQILPSKILDARLFEVPPLRVLDTISEASSLTGEHKRIMEHPREAVQGLNHDIIHGDMLHSSAPFSLWKHIDVRRFVLLTKWVIDDGTQCVIFEPNGEPLWLRDSI